jgi:hypothetical protein
MANPYGTKDDSTIHPRTIPIVGIQSGVTDGKRDNQLFMFIIIIYQVTLILMLKEIGNSLY